MNAAVDIHVAAQAVYDAMRAPTPATVLADALLATTDRAARASLLAKADKAVALDAAAYIKLPEATRERERRLAWMRADARRVAALKTYYASHIPDFIDDWGQTLDPRLLARGGDSSVPFKLFPKQREMLEWMLDRYHGREPGVVVKSRDVGASWVAVALLGSLALFNPNFVAIIASALEVKLDRSGDTSTLFYKLRMFLAYLPEEFRGGWEESKHAAYLRVHFPNGSSITGEAGDQIGRGARAAIAIVDEAAHIPHPASIDAALAATTECRIDMSSVNGIANTFYEKAHNAAIPRFDFSWRDDPRKDQAWYDKQCAMFSAVLVASEIDCDFAASVENVIIPSAHVQAAIDSHLKLNITPSGIRLGALDVAAGGADKNAFAVRTGMLLEHVESWTSGADLYKTCVRAFAIADAHDLDQFDYDAVGVGAAVEGDARQINAKRTEADPVTQRPKGTAIRVEPFKGSEAPLFPSRRVPRTKLTNEMYFANRKAQAWIHFAMRLAETYKAVRGEPHDAGMVVSINSKIKELSRLVSELSQATASDTANGKRRVDKAPDGAPSPNLADAVVIAYAPRKTPLWFSDQDVRDMES